MGNMREKASSVLIIISVLELISCCSESAAVPRLERNSQEVESAGSSVLEAAPISPEFPGENNEVFYRENNNHRQHRIQDTQNRRTSKFMRGVKWIRIGCIGFLEGVGRTLGVVGGLGICGVSIVGGFAAAAFTGGTGITFMAGLGTILGGTIICGSVSLPSITKRLAVQHMR